MFTQLKSRFFTLRCMQTGLCAVIISGLFVGGLPMSVGSFAVAQPVQNSGAKALPADTVTVSELVRLLTSPIDARRDQAFHRMRELAQRVPDIDLSSAVPALVDTYKNDPDEKYRLAAVVTLYLIGDDVGMQEVRQHFAQEPSLTVQYVSVCTLIDRYGPRAFGGNREATALARNVLARKHAAQRLADRRNLRMVPRVTAGPLEVVPSDSLQ